MINATSNPISTIEVNAEPFHLFNMPISEMPLVIDVRPSDCYSASHVQGAINLNQEICRDSIEVPLRNYLQNEYPDNMATICIYSDLDDESLSSSSFIGVLIEFLSEVGIPWSRSNWKKPNSILHIRSFDKVSKEFPFIITHNAGTERIGDDCPLGNQFDIFYPSMICPWGLFLGSISNADNLDVLRQLSISLIINITKEPNIFQDTPGISYLRLPCDDDSSQDMTSIWHSAAEAIHEARQKQARVLVHCHAGKSRSASAVLNYLMRFDRMTLEEALAHCRMCRPVVQPNPGFYLQLLRVERQRELLLEQQQQQHYEMAPLSHDGSSNASETIFENREVIDKDDYNPEI